MTNRNLLLSLIFILSFGSLFSQTKNQALSLGSRNTGITSAYQTGINIREYFFSANAISYPNAHSFRWDFGDGSPIMPRLSSVHTYSTSGNYNVCLNIIDTNFTSIGGGCIVINVIDTITPDSIPCGISKSLDANRNITITSAAPMPSRIMSQEIMIAGASYAFGSTSDSAGMIPGNSNTYGKMAPGLYTLVINNFYDGLATNLFCRAVDTLIIPALVADTFNCGFSNVSLGNFQQSLTLLDSTIYFSAGLKTTWDFGDGSPLDYGFHVKHTFPTNGTYNVCATTIDVNGNVVCHYCKYITVTVYPTINCGIKTNHIATNINEFYLKDSLLQNTSLFTTTWNFGDSTATQVGFNIQHTFPTNGTFNVCSYTVDSNSILVCETCNLYFVNDSVMDSNLDFSFNGTDIGNLTVQMESDTALSLAEGLITQWTYGDSTTATTSTTHTYSAPGTYQVCMTLYSHNMSLGSACQTIVVNPIVNCNFNYFSDHTNSTLYLYPDSSLINLGCTYYWDYGDGTQGSSNTHVYSIPGTYNVSMSVSDSIGGYFCSHASGTGLVIEGPYFGCDFQYTQSTTNPNEFTFIGNSAIGNTSIAWNFGDGTTGSGNSATHNFATSGIFNVLQTIISNTTGQVLCGSSQQVSVNVPVVNCNFMASSTGDYTLSVTPFDTMMTSAAVNLVWNYGDGSASSSNYSHTYSLGGYYTITVTAYDTAGTQLCTSSIQALVADPSFCNFTSSPVAGSPFEMQFIPVANNITNDYHYWYFAGGQPYYGDTINYTFPGAGTYNVTMGIGLANGTNYCEVTLPVTVVETAACNHLFTSTINKDFLHQQTNVEFLIYSIDSTTTDAFVRFQDGQTFPTISWPLNMNMVYYDAILPPLDTVFTVYADIYINSVFTCTIKDTVVISGWGVNSQSGYSCILTDYAMSGNRFEKTPVISTANFPKDTKFNWIFKQDTVIVHSVINTNSYEHYTFNNSFFGNASACVEAMDTLGNILCTNCINFFFPDTDAYCHINYNIDTMNLHKVNFNAEVPQGVNPSVYYQCQLIFNYGDGNIDTGNGHQSYTHIYANQGTYVVCMTKNNLNNGMSCSVCDTIVIGVPPIPYNCKANFESVTDSLNAYFIDMSLGNPSTTTYTWSFGDGTTSTSRYPQHTYSTADNYSVCLLINNNGCRDSICKVVNVTSTTVVNPTCNAHFVFTQDTLYNISIVDMSSGTNIHHSWNFGDGTITNQDYPTHTYGSTGSYNICLTVTSNNGCSNTYCDTLVLDSLGFQRRGFNVNVTSPKKITAITSVARTIAQPKIFPNPFANDLTINDQSSTFTTYQIIGVDGRIVSEGKINNVDTKITTSEISVGVYILELSNSQTTQRYKLIKK